MMYDGHSFYINDPNWRNYTSKTELVYVSPEIVATEYEVLLAIEKLTPYTQRVHERSAREQVRDGTESAPESSHPTEEELGEHQQAAVVAEVVIDEGERLVIVKCFGVIGAIEDELVHELGLGGIAHVENLHSHAFL